MRNNRSLNVRTIVLAAILGLPMFLLGGGAAHAQTPTPTPPANFDYAGLAGTAKSEINSAVGEFMPVVMGIFVTMIAIAVLFKWSKRGMKTS